MLEYVKQKGISPFDFKKHAYAQFVWRKLLQQLVVHGQNLTKRKINARYNEVTQSYIKYKLQEIVLPYTNKEQKQQTLDKALSIYKKINNNTITFEKAANSFSQSQSSSNGGNIGWFSMSTMPGIYKPYIKKLNVGQISKPISLKNNVIILKIDQKQKKT